MKKNWTFLSVVISLALCSGCGKSGIDCFTNAGTITTEERFLQPFDSIIVANNINLFLTCDSGFSTKVEAGENLLDEIITTVENGQLILENHNTCNWVRDFDNPINVYISTPYLWKIHYISSGDMHSLNTLTFDSLKLEIWGGCGSIHLAVDIRQGFFYLHQGTSDIHLTGTCDFVSLVTGDYGLLDAGKLSSSYTYVSSRSSNNCYVHASQELTASVESIGNIYYYGKPKKIITTITGSGSVIALE